MQSAPVSSLASNAQTQPRYQSYFQQQSYREQNDMTIEYTGEGGDLFLHVSTDISYTSTLYTEQGYLPSNSSDAGIFTTTLLPDSTDENETPTVANMSLNTYEALLQKYYELILERVTYLLGEMSNNQEGNTQAGRVENTTVSYAESLSVSKSLTIGGTVTDPNYFSAENTSQRIVSFALSFYDGGDRNEYADMVRDAVNKGFEQALGALGGSLPEISFKTMEIVNQAIDTFSMAQTIDTQV